jgi:hypothetical protein
VGARGRDPVHYRGHYRGDYREDYRGSAGLRRLAARALTPGLKSRTASRCSRTTRLIDRLARRAT